MPNSYNPAKPINNLKRPNFVIQEQNLTLLAASLVKLSTLTLSSVGLSAFSLNKLSALVGKNVGADSLLHAPIEAAHSVAQNLESGIPLPIAISGMAAWAIIKFSAGNAMNSIQEVVAEGADSILTDNHLHSTIDGSLPYRGQAKKAFVKLYAKELKDALISSYEKVKQAFSFSEIEPPYFNHEELDVNVDNIVHLLALLGQDETPEAIAIKAAPEFGHETVQHIFDDSELLCKALVDNMDNVKDFVKDLESCMGNDAAYIIDNFSNYVKGRKDFFNIKRDAIKATTEDFQKYNIHQYFSSIAADCITRSMKGTLDTKRAKETVIALSHFENLAHFKPTHNPFNACIATAQEVESALIEYIENGVSRPLHQIICQKLNIETPPKNSDPDAVAYSIYGRLFEQDVPIPDDFEKQMAKNMFRQMENRLIKKYAADPDFLPSKTSTKKNHEKHEIATKHGFETFGSLNPEAAAKKTMLRIQQRMFQKHASAMQI